MISDSTPSIIPPVIELILDLLLVATIIYFGLVRGRGTDSANPAETAGRSVLIGTLSSTIFIILRGFDQSSTHEFPSIPEGVLTLNGLAVAIYVIIQLVASADSGRESRIRLAQAQQKVLDNPDNIGYAWNLSIATLEDYMNRNISQVKWIFNIAVLVMVCGFGIIGYGVSLALQKNVPIGIATSASGVLTQFISVTLMVIYRSTMAQANSYVTIVERLNSVGMAAQQVNNIPDEQAELKNATRVEIIRFLIAQTKHAASAPDDLPYQSHKGRKPVVAE